MTLNELQISYMKAASGLKDYQNISKTDLGNGYCDAEESGNDLLKNQYWAAIVLRYWYKLFNWMQKSASCKLQPEDFVMWLEHTLWIVFYYRSWRYEYKAIVKDGKFIDWEYDEEGNKIPNPYYYKVDPNAFDRTVNFFAACQRGREYQYLNKDKHKSHILSSSLDMAVENIGDAALEQAGATEEFDKIDGIKSLILKLIDQNRTIEAFIVDGICYHHAFKEEKEKIDCPYSEEELEELSFKPEKYTYSHTFNPRLLVKHLSSIDEKFMRSYFQPQYELDEEVSEYMYNKLKQVNNNKLYKYIKKTLINIRTEPDLLAYIAN